MRSFFDLPGAFQLDVLYRASSAIRSLPDIVTGGGFPGYEELDLRLAWHGWRQMELSRGGRNLLHASHVEFGAPLARSAIQHVERRNRSIRRVCPSVAAQNSDRGRRPAHHRVAA